MATGHLQPGYGDPISRMHRVQSAKYPLDRQTLLRIDQETRLEKDEMESIRKNAQRLWSYKEREETSYDNHFMERPADELMTVRPTSPTRRNKPHPIPVFLTNRLHYISGYHNPDAALGKEAYRVDGSVPPEERERRTSVRRKYLGRPDSANVNTYSDPYGLKDHMDSRSAQAAEAWLKIADDEDHDNVMNVVHKFRTEEKALDQGSRNGCRPVSAYPSMHRWMKFAGAKEADAVGRIVQTLDTDPDMGYSLPKPAPNLLALRRKDIAAMNNVNFKRPKPSRGDFLIHPDWPPSLKHHRIP